MFCVAKGQGPSEANMDRGFLKVTAVAKGSSGSTTRSPPPLISTFHVNHSSHINLSSHITFLLISTPPSSPTPPSHPHSHTPILRLVTHPLVASRCAFFPGRVMFYCPTDPGYRDTARMLVESGAHTLLTHTLLIHTLLTHTLLLSFPLSSSPLI